MLDGVLLFFAIVLQLQGYRVVTTYSRVNSLGHPLLRRPARPKQLKRLLTSAWMDDPAPISSTFKDVETRVQKAFRRLVYFNHPDKTGESTTRFVMPRLVAVSKTKPVELLREAYDAGCRDFGENYVEELIGKAADMPEDVAWRFIGRLQSNKAKRLVHGVRSLGCIETVASSKLADKLQLAVASLDPPRETPLEVMIQVNTSPWEGTKGGVLAEEAPGIAAHVVSECPLLKLVGVMTIGEPGNSVCFDALAKCRAEVAERIDVEDESLELSMGMSGDFEAAIAKGSTSVRVGSLIFGAREYPTNQ